GRRQATSDARRAPRIPIVRLAGSGAPCTGGGGGGTSPPPGGVSPPPVGGGGGGGLPPSCGGGFPWFVVGGGGGGGVPPRMKNARASGALMIKNPMAATAVNSNLRQFFQASMTDLPAPLAPSNWA